MSNAVSVSVAVSPARFSYSEWRHGGWYVHDVRYPSGAIGCVSRNYPDGKWRIVCGDQSQTFKTRDAAARAEFAIAEAQRIAAEVPQAEPEARPAPAIAKEWRPDDAAARYVPKMCSMRCWGAYDVELSRFHLDDKGRPVAFDLGVEAQALCDRLNSAPHMVPQVAQQHQGQAAPIPHARVTIRDNLCRQEWSAVAALPTLAFQDAMATAPRAGLVTNAKAAFDAAWPYYAGNISAATRGDITVRIEAVQPAMVPQPCQQQQGMAPGMAAMEWAPELLEALQGVLPYAESRLEDMEASCEAAGGYIDEETNKARLAIEAARQVIVHAKG